MPNQSTTRLPTSTSKEQDILSLSPVTLQPGGPAILPLYEEDLAKAIKLGSRVVRGRDWAWGDQVKSVCLMMMMHGIFTSKLIK